MGVGNSLDPQDGSRGFALASDLDFAHFNPLALHPGTKLFESEFGKKADGTWVDLVLDPGVAPYGDILWRSENLPLDVILRHVRRAYAAFYCGDRLARVLQALPSPEVPRVEAAYASYGAPQEVARF